MNAKISYQLGKLLLNSNHKINIFTNGNQSSAYKVKGKLFYSFGNKLTPDDLYEFGFKLTVFANEKIQESRISGTISIHNQGNLPFKYEPAPND